MPLEIQYQEWCSHCTSPAVGYFKRPVMDMEHANAKTWLCRVHMAFYPMGQVDLIRVVARQGGSTQ